MNVVSAGRAEIVHVFLFNHSFFLTPDLEVLVVFIVF